MADDLTGFLDDLCRGQAGAAETLMPYVYNELRAIAEGYLRRWSPGQTLQPTVLVHEVFLKLFDPARVSWNDRHHFFAVAAKAMRRLVVDHARRRRQRAAHQQPSLDSMFMPDSKLGFDVVDLEMTLQELEKVDPRRSQVVELRYFGGLEVDQVALVLQVSRSTVEREWRSARAWLGSRLRGDS